MAPQQQSGYMQESLIKDTESAADAESQVLPTLKST